MLEKVVVGGGGGRQEVWRGGQGGASLADAGGLLQGSKSAGQLDVGQEDLLGELLPARVGLDEVGWRLLHQWEREFINTPTTTDVIIIIIIIISSSSSSIASSLLSSFLSF